jgi:hypothetical protein
MNQNENDKGPFITKNWFFDNRLETMTLRSAIGNAGLIPLSPGYWIRTMLTGLLNESQVSPHSNK